MTTKDVMISFLCGLPALALAVAISYFGFRGAEPLPKVKNPSTITMKEYYMSERERKNAILDRLSLFMPYILDKKASK